MNYVAISQNDVLKMGVERNSNNNVNSQGYNWHHEWFKALNALDYLSYRYKYFYLENPPKNQGNDNSGEVYDSVQERIWLNIDFLINEYGSKQYIKEMSEKIRKQLIDLRERSIAEERALYDELYYYGEVDFGNQSYSELVENTKPGAIVPGKNTIELWTYKVFPTKYKKNGGTEYNEQFNFAYFNDVAFSLVVGSKEFYKKFTILEKKRMSAYFKKISENTIPSNKIIELYRAFANAIFQNTAGAVGEDFLKKLKSIFEESLSESYSSAPLEVKITDFPREINFDFVENFQDEWQKMSSEGTDRAAFEKLLPKFQEALRDFNSHLVNYDVNSQANLFKLTQTINLGKDFVLTDNSNLLYLKQLQLEFDKNGELSVNSKHKILSDVIKTMVDAMKMMQEEQSLTLNDLSLGIINFDDINYKKETILSAINYCERVLPELLSQKTQRNPELWKAFLAQNSNKWISGLFGEITALANFTKLSSKQSASGPTNPRYKVKLTGSTQASVNGKRLGGSVNDITLVKREQLGNSRKKYKFVRHGINVKHYVRQTDGIFKLYEGSGNNGIFSSRTAKYLNAYQLNIVRFVLANSNFFEQENGGKKTIIQDIIFNIALESIPEYLRISDRTRQSANNLFFQINNIIYPTSYIYDCALAQLDWLVSRTNDKEAFMNVEVIEEGLDKGKSYKNLANARRYWSDKNYRLSTSKKPEGKNAKIKTNGIKINLVSL